MFKSNHRVSIGGTKMYKKITIENFRGIKHLVIDDFRQVNLFVGKNNCGKTSILESLFLLTGPTNAELPLRINTFRNLTIVDENSWRVIFNKLDVDSTIKISGELGKETRELKISPDKKSVFALPQTTIDKGELDIKSSYSAQSYAIDGLVLEYIRYKNKKPQKITTSIIANGTGIKIKPPEKYKESLRAVFINPRTIFSSRDMAKRFSDILIRKREDRIIKVLRQIEPSLKDLSLGVGDIIYCDIGLNRLVPLNVMGDGMVRLLSIILTISDTENGIVLIDEIENGFHYTSQDILWNTIFAAAKEYNVQIFATTHSMECVNAFSSSYYSLYGENEDKIRLFRIEKKDDSLKAISYDYRTLKVSLERDWEVR